MLYFMLLLTICSPDAKPHCRTQVHSYWSLDYECVRKAQQLNKRHVRAHCVPLMMMDDEDKQ